MRHRPELNRNRGGFFRHSFSSAQKEGNPLPSPVVDIKLDRCIGLGIGSWVDTSLLPIAGHSVSFDPSLCVLAPNSIFINVFRSNAFYCSQYIHFPVPNFFGLKRYWRFHGDHAQDRSEEHTSELQSRP